MCLAIPGKIKEVKDKTVIVEYPSEDREVMADPGIPLEQGDYVMVQMGMVIQKIPEKQAKESLQEWSNVGQ